MTPERWREVDRIFAVALDTPPAGRQAWLETACAGDPELRREIEELLAADEGGGTSLLGNPARDWEGLGTDEEEDALVGERLGPYRLVSRLGRGGMGAVYLAERDDGQYASRVAVKVLRRDLLGAETRQRFLAERQILARLEHPNVARLYDGGTTPDGRPFLVMEHVEGLPLHADCDRRELPVDARLDLFIRICMAVHHAHQHLLVHRDLKPGNILVTEGGEPKLLDFGIAKELAPLDPTTGAFETRTGIRVMTPAYASPEQVRGEPVTTASDVYALGVLLYELLAGVSPYHVDPARLHDLERAVCDAEPERPSEALGRAADPVEAARRRGTTLRELRRRLRGDLDTIVLKALRKDPARRYGSAAELAQDLERHRRHQPVSARPDSFSYRAGTFVRRHRFGVATAGLGLAVLAVLLVGLAVQRQRAVRERDKARHSLDFLVGVFEDANPFKTGGQHLTAKDILAEGEKRVRRELADQPEVRAELMDAIGRVYLGLGMPEQSEPLLTDALALRQKLGAPPLELAASLSSLAQLRMKEGDLGQGTRLYQQALDLRQKTLGEDDPKVAETLDNVADAYSIADRNDEAEALHRRALAIWRRLEKPAGTGTARTLVLLAKLARDVGHYDQAEELYRQALAIERRVLGPRHPQVAANLSTWALVRNDRGDIAGSETLLVEALDIQRSTLEPWHPDLLTTLNNLAITYRAQGDLARAETMNREIVAQFRKRFNTRADFAAALHNLATSVMDLGRPEEAIPLHEEALALRRKIFGERHPEVAFSLMLLGRGHHKAGHLQEAESLLRQSLALNIEVQGPDHPMVSHVLWDLGRLLLDENRPAEAEPAFRRSLEIRQKKLPPEHYEIARTKGWLGGSLARLGRFQEAEDLLLPAYQALATQFRPGDKRAADLAGHLAVLYRAWGREKEANRYEALSEPTPPPPPGNAQAVRSPP